MKRVENGQLTCVLPSLLPLNDTILYIVRKHMAFGDEEATALNLTTGVGKILLKNAVDAEWRRHIDEPNNSLPPTPPGAIVRSCG